MASNRITVFVSQGIVDEVYDDRGLTNYAVFDEDLLEDGTCPVCYTNGLETIGAKVKTIKKLEIVKSETIEYMDREGITHSESRITRDEEGNPIIDTIETTITSGGIDTCQNCGWDENKTYKEIHELKWRKDEETS